MHLHSPSFRPRPLLAAVLLTLAAAGGPIQAQTPPASPPAEAMMDWDLPAGPLDESLARIARLSGRSIIADPALLQGKTAPRVQGRLSPEAAAQRALAGSGLVLARTASGTLTVRPGAEPAATVPAPAIPARPAAPAAERNLEPVRVTASRLEERAEGPVGGLIARRSATATKTDTSLLETPQTISVVSREQIELQDAQSVTRALEYTPGTIASFGGTNSQSDVVQTRGFYPRDHLDGLRLPFSAYSVAVPQLDPYMLERIELLQGPASVLFGQTSPGGVLNMISRRPQAEAAHELQLQAGNFDRKRLAFDSTGRLDGEGKFLYRLTGLVRDNDGQIDHSSEWRGLIAPAFTWRPSGATSFTLLSHYQRDDWLPQYQSVPAAGSLLPNPNGRIPRSRLPGDPGWDRVEREQYGIGYALEHRLESGWTLRQNLRQTGVEVETRALPGIALAADGRTLSRVATAGQAAGRIFAVDNQAQVGFAAAGIQHTLLFGLDYLRQNDDYRFASQLAPSLDLYAPVYGAAIPALVPRLSTMHQMSQTGLYLQDQMRSGRWRLTVGARYDRADSDTANRIANTVVSKSDSAVTGRVGVNYVLDSGLAPYASYATSFEPLGGTDFSGNPFEPTKGRQLEAGIKYQPPGGTTQLGLAVYRLVQENVLTPDTTPGRTGFSVQTGEVQVDGVSAELRTQPLRNVDLVATYAYTDSEITRANPDASGGSMLGRPLPRTPRHTASLWLGYRITEGPLDGVTAGLGLRYLGSNFTDTATTLQLPALTLLDLALHYDFGRRNPDLTGWRLSLGVANLADREYVSYCLSTAQCFYGQPRTVQLTLRKRW